MTAVKTQIEIKLSYLHLFLKKISKGFEIIFLKRYADECIILLPFKFLLIPPLQQKLLMREGIKGADPTLYPRNVHKLL